MDEVADHPADHLARGRDGRYQSAREMQADLEAFIRHERLPVSAVTMTGWMQSLFEESLLQQKAALQDIKQLADRIAAEAPQEYAPASTGSHPGAQFDQSKTGTALPGAAASIAPPSTLMCAAASLRA